MQAASAGRPEAAGAAHDLALHLRAPVDADRAGLGLHLGRGPDGTAYVGVVTSEPPPDRGADGTGTGRSRG